MGICSSNSPDIEEPFLAPDPMVQSSGILTECQRILVRACKEDELRVHMRLLEHLRTFGSDNKEHMCKLEKHINCIREELKIYN